jgi:hypothetical protein
VRSQDNSVIATVLRADVQGTVFLFTTGQEIFLFSKISRPKVLFPEIKEPGSETDHGPPSGSCVKNTWNLPPLSHPPSSCTQ